MKKILGIIFVVLMALVGLNSCGDEAVDVNEVNQQTILIFLPWSGSDNSNGLYSEFETNLDSIEKGIIANKGLSNRRVLAFISRPKESGYGYGKSYLYELQYNVTTRKMDYIQLDVFEGNSYNSAAGITQILNEVKQKAEALNYAMIIGAHGNGWTHANDWNSYPYNAPMRKLKTRYFGSVSSDGDAYKIEVSTLAQGIEESGIKMQYIALDACYMANVETAYELRNATNYMIASTSETLATGWPYAKIWNFLSANVPNYSSIVSNYVSYFKNSNNPYGQLAAIDCRQMEGLASVMKEINAKYQLDESKLEDLQVLDGFRPRLYYDLGNYVDNLVPTGYLKEQFNNQLKKVVKSSGTTDLYISDLYGAENTYPIQNFCGIATSDPSMSPVALRGREKTAWWQATH